MDAAVPARASRRRHRSRRNGRGEAGVGSDGGHERRHGQATALEQGRDRAKNTRASSPQNRRPQGERGPVRVHRNTERGEAVRPRKHLRVQTGQLRKIRTRMAATSCGKLLESSARSGSARTREGSARWRTQQRTARNQVRTRSPRVRRTFASQTRASAPTSRDSDKDGVLMPKFYGINMRPRSGRATGGGEPSTRPCAGWRAVEPEQGQDEIMKRRRRRRTRSGARLKGRERRAVSSSTRRMSGRFVDSLSIARRLAIKILEAWAAAADGARRVEDFRRGRRVFAANSVGRSTRCRLGARRTRGSSPSADAAETRTSRRRALLPPP